MDIHVAGERAMLEGLLDVQLGADRGLLDGLDEEEVRARLVPSLTAPPGLVRHATFVERVWFRHRVVSVPRADLALPDTVDESFVLDAGDTVG